MLGIPFKFPQSLKKIKSKTKSLRVSASHRGLTLLEACIGMMVMSVLCVAISSLIRGSMEATLHDRAASIMQTVATNIMADIRFDMQQAQSATIVATNQLRIVVPNNTGGTYNVTYSLSGTGYFTRTSTGATEPPLKCYNQNLLGGACATNMSPDVRISCEPVVWATTTPTTTVNTTCFSAPAGMTNPNGTMQIRIADISATAPDLQQRTALANFGAPRFRLSGSSFSVLGNTEFQ